MEYPKFVALQATAEVLSKTQVRTVSRSHAFTIDEPKSGGGDDKGPQPLEALVSAFAGCTNVIAHRLADELGIDLTIKEINAKATVDTGLLKQNNTIEIPFPKLQFDVTASSQAGDAKLAELRKQLEICCPVSALFRAAGTNISSQWHLVDTNEPHS